MKELAGWIVGKLGDVIQKTETINPPQTPNKEFIYIDVSSVNNKTFSIEEVSLIKGKNAPSRARKFIKTGDVIFATVRPTLKRIAIIPEEYDRQICSTGYFVLRAKEFINNKFLFYYLQTDSFNERMEKLQKGASYPAVTDTEVREQIILYPPLPEQQRIVSVLDEAFASVAQAKANAERNLVNARELFEGAQRELFEGIGNKKSEVKILGGIATFRNGINFTKASKGETVKIVGVKDFQNYFWVPLDNLDSVTIDGKLNETDYLRKGDILAVRSNGNQQLIGRSILAGDVSEKTTHSGFTIRIRFETKDVFPEYLCHYLKSEKARKQLISGGAGISIKSLNQTTLSELPISLPPLAEQRAIVAKLDALSAETKRLEEIYRRKVAALEELKKSVLGKAFEGNL